MVERFNAVARRGNLNFEAWFNDHREPDRSWTVDESVWEFSYRFLPTVEFGRYRLHLPTPLLGKSMPDVLVSLYAQPSFVLGWLVARARKRRIAFWAQVTHDNWVARKRWKEALKRIMFSRVDAVLGSGEESRKFAMRYGASANQAIILQHSIDTVHFRDGSREARNRRDNVRAQLGLKGTTFIYVGRLWTGKGLNHLLDAFGSIQGRLAESVSLLIVGDGQAENALRARCESEGIHNVVFAGFRGKEELLEMYAAADVFVFPTLGDPYGLAVDEAMVCGLPVISSDAAGEIRQRVEDGVNGYVVEAGNSAALVPPMLKLASDQVLRRSMAEQCPLKVEGNTPEKWATDFEGIVEKLLLDQTGLGKK